MYTIEFDRNKVDNTKKKIIRCFFTDTNNTLTAIRDSIFITTISTTKKGMKSPNNLLSEYNTNLYYIGLNNINSDILDSDYMIDNCNIDNYKEYPNDDYILVFGFNNLDFIPIFKYKNNKYFISNNSIIGYIHNNKLIKNNNYKNKQKYNKEYNIFNNNECNYDKSLEGIYNIILYFINLIIKYDYKIDLDSYNSLSDIYLENLKIIRKIQNEK